MKIAISSQGKDLSSPADPRFGRTKFFIVVDTDTGAFTAHDNSQNLNAPQGAGIQAAKNVNDLGVQAVISGNMGPKAYAVLQSAGIDIYTGATGTVKETLEAFKTGKLNKAAKANVEGHW
ncbi:MAG: NifB/NifX family molybdenum-iron cluster-binding protein [Candidatus Latescibacteria bacterium]|nr:NifB/NifX family molybdenum-iron cluster-binding protein [Candidatus Latescibacterota bacterium]